VCLRCLHPTRNATIPYVSLFRSAHALEADAAGLDGREDADVEAGGVMLLQIRLDLADEVGVVRAAVVEPEDGGHSGGARAADGRSEEHTSELQSRENIVCRILLD